jgi:acyl-CoA thioesterase
MESLYVAEGGRFIATEQTRGPWSAEHQHGGPVAALLARELERAVGDAQFQPARVTLEFLKPLPIAPIEVKTTLTREGRKVRTAVATASVKGEPIARAEALFMRRREVEASAQPPFAPLPSPATLAPYSFVFFRSPVGYHTAMESRLVRGEWPSGAMTIWMRLKIPVVAGEKPSPLQRVLVAADSGNGVSAAIDPLRFTFLNADLTLHLHRPLDGEWVCLDAATTVSPGGIGLAECALSDERGPIGRSLQSLIIEPR